MLLFVAFQSPSPFPRVCFIVTELANICIHSPPPYANPFQDSTGLFYGVCKCEHRHVSALERENNALQCAWKHRRNSLFCVAPQGSRWASSSWPCSSDTGAPLFVFFTVLPGTRGYVSLFCALTHISFGLQNKHTTALGLAHSPPKHKNIMLMRQAQLFPSSPSLSLSFSFNSRLISPVPLKSRQAETVNANISLWEIRSIFTNPSYSFLPKSDVWLTHSVFSVMRVNHSAPHRTWRHRPLRSTEETILTAHYIQTCYTVTDALWRVWLWCRMQVIKKIKIYICGTAPWLNQANVKIYAT